MMNILYYYELYKIEMCHKQKVQHLNIVHQLNNLCKSRITMDLVLNLEEL